MRLGIVRTVVLWILILIPVLLTLVACGAQSGTPAMPDDGAILLNTPTSDLAILAAVQTQQQNNTDDHAVATAEIVRANAQGTLNSANATLNAVQTQDQNDVNLVAAEVAATAEAVRANAEATLNSAGSTQSAALTQDVILQTQIVEAMANQQNKDELAATQTAVANDIATQTQAAVTLSEIYADQLEEQRRGPITFLWTWCLPIFGVLFAGLILWGFWRWLKIQQSNQRILKISVHKLPAPEAVNMHHQPEDLLPYLEIDMVNSRDQFTKSDDEMRRWLDVVRRRLLGGDAKDENHSADN